MNHAKLKKIVFRCLHCLLMGTISVIMVLPFSWMLATSMRKASNSFTLPPAIFPTIWNGENYRRVFEELKICNYMVNSLIVTLGSLVIMVLFTSMAAYAFSRIEFKGRNVLFPVLLAGLMIMPHYLQKLCQRTRLARGFFDERKRNSFKSKG